MNKILAIAIAHIFFLVSFPQLLNAQWVQTFGPGGGDVSEMEVCGTKIFASTNYGLFCSNNNGASWVAYNSGFPATYISSIVKNGNSLYACANSHILNRSTPAARGCN